MCIVHSTKYLSMIVLGNPLCEPLEESVWRSECMKKLPKIAILDGIPTAGKE